MIEVGEATLTFTGGKRVSRRCDQIGRPAPKLSEAMAGSFVISAFGREPEGAKRPP